MKKLLFAFLLAGCVSTTPSNPGLPTLLVGQWVSADFKPAPDENAEPYGGNAIYLLEGGQACVWETEIGVPCLASYSEADHTLVLKEVQVDPGPFTPTIVRYIYDPKAGTLKEAANRASGRSGDRSPEIFHRRSATVPKFVRQAWRQP